MWHFEIVLVRINGHILIVFGNKIVIFLYKNAPPLNTMQYPSRSQSLHGGCLYKWSSGHRGERGSRDRSQRWEGHHRIGASYLGWQQNYPRWWWVRMSLFLYFVNIPFIRFRDLFQGYRACNIIQHINREQGSLNGWKYTSIINMINAE